MARILGKAAHMLQERAVSAPEEKQLEPKNDDGQNHKCDDCGFVAKSEFGLQAHKKAHKGGE